MEDGRDTVIISKLVLLEVIEVIRKRITEKENYAGVTPEINHEIKSKIERATMNFVDRTTKLAAQGKARLVDSDQSVVDFFEAAMQAIRPYFGEISSTNVCNFCQRTFPEKYRYRGLGHYDIEHALNALECSADEICSFDRAFERLNTIPKFSSLKTSVY